MAEHDEPRLERLAKTATGIAGLDELTGGGLPRGRPTLVCGGPGCGKTLLAMEFLVRGATRFGEPGVFVAFEETAEELAQNAASLGFDLARLERENRLVVDHVRIDRSAIEESGDYDLGGLFIRLGHAIDSIGAKRVVLDTIETLFGGLRDEAILRAELRRMFRWLKDKRVTAIVTAERGSGSLARHGLEEYVSDCVILLDHRVTEQVSTRRLRVVKYRGSHHGTNEYPYLIGANGIHVLPISSLALNQGVSDERVSTGVAGLDAMLGGGVFRGSSVLVSGPPGAGKTSFAARFAAATCESGGRCVWMAFEESPGQILRNMRSIGIDLEPFMRHEHLRIHADRPTSHGLETHLVVLHGLVEALAPQLVIIDPVTALAAAGTRLDVEAMLIRVVDFLKGRGITALLTSLMRVGHGELPKSGISSIVDTWIQLSGIDGERKRRRLFILKSRGMAHATDVREFRLSSAGVEIAPAPAGSESGKGGAG